MESSLLLFTIVVLLVAYVLMKWWQNPIKRIPGPRGLPLIGNTLSFSLQSMHEQCYHMARKYGDVTKIYIFNIPVVFLNSTEVCLDALIRTGTDFQGRPKLARAGKMIGKDLATMSCNEPDFPAMRHLATKGLKSYGPGIAHLERIIEETVAEVLDLLHSKEGQPVDTQHLANGYICCVLASILFGEKYSYDDPVCQSLHQMNESIIEVVDPMSPAAILDFFPFLLNFKFLFRSFHDKMDKTAKLIDDFAFGRIKEAKDSFDGANKRGCLDYFIEAQREEVGSDGTPLIDDQCLKGLLLDFVTGGVETSLSSLSQVFLDMLHDLDLQRRLQEEIDSKFTPTQMITMNDRNKLPLVNAYVYENLRYMSVSAFLVPHATIRDTQVGGYQIPANTRVLMNSYHTSHNPDVYDEPFKVKPERFLTQDGSLVEPGHPHRQNLIAFGAGRRVCPAELLAKSRIFLFIANILHKFTVEPVGQLPDRDVRKYEFGIILKPPKVTARFIRRQ